MEISKKFKTLLVLSLLLNVLNFGYIAYTNVMAVKTFGTMNELVDQKLERQRLEMTLDNYKVRAQDRELAKLDAQNQTTSQ